jgi:hypothetical protein
MTLIGRLADTPELQATSTGKEILRYAVGVNSGPKDNQTTSWFRVTAFTEEGPQRDFIAGLEKGYVIQSRLLFMWMCCARDVGGLRVGVEGGMFGELGNRGKWQRKMERATRATLS